MSWEVARGLAYKLPLPSQTLAGVISPKGGYKANPIAELCE